MASIIVFIYSYQREHLAENEAFTELASYAHTQLRQQMRQALLLASLLNEHPQPVMLNSLTSGRKLARQDGFPLIAVSPGAPVTDGARQAGQVLRIDLPGAGGQRAFAVSAARVLQTVLSGLRSSTHAAISLAAYSGKAAKRPNLVFLTSVGGPPQAPCIFSCGPASVANTYQWGGSDWHIVMSKGAEPFLTAHAGSLGFLLAGLLASIGAALHLQARQSHTQQAYQLAARRSAELRSLNGILIADIEARKKLADDLGQSQRQLRELAEHNARVKEDERKRIAREIHDDLGQSMLALRIDLSILANGDLADIERKRIHQALLQIDNTIDAMRMIINELRPAVLDLGLDAALEWEVSKFQRRTGITCHLTMSGEPFVLCDDVATALYRVVQESMTNIMRHAQASCVEIRLWSDNDWIFLTLADNGVGISEQCRRKAKSFGLIGIAERIYALGGAFDTDSATGRGTTLTIAVPFASATAVGMA